jgi:PqqD family protein of HPr-rel-A system
MYWSIARGQALAWDDYESEAIVFDPVSGSTHLLNATAVEALLALERSARPLESREVRQAVVGALGLAPDDIPEPAIDELLEHLDRIGLIEPHDAGL